jgi:PHD/YefM family antitoxin component YafN of YafNO toxin-antitoxin module
MFARHVNRTFHRFFMRRVNATDFTTHFGEFVEFVRDEPIEVLRGGKPVGVFLSPDEFAHFRRLADAYWAARAHIADARGEWIGHDEAMRLLTERLKQEK